MAIFWIGGPEGVIVPSEELNTTDDDRYFLPGVIHGSEEYIIQASAYNNDGTAEGEKIHIRYLYAVDILEWVKQSMNDNGTLNCDAFEECLCESRDQFIVDNDGSGDFVSLNNVWDKSISMDYADLVVWAMWKEKQDDTKSA